MDAPVAYYPASWDMPLTRSARLCANRALERQLDFMTTRGWPVEKPVLRITADPGLVFRAQGQTVMGGTFDTTTGWHVILPAGAERELCRNETRTRAGLLPDGLISINTVFHELSHQVLPPSEPAVIYRAGRLTANFLRHIQHTRVRLWPALTWRSS